MVSIKQLTVILFWVVVGFGEFIGVFSNTYIPTGKLIKLSELNAFTLIDPLSGPE